MNTQNQNIKINKGIEECHRVNKCGHKSHFWSPVIIGALIGIGISFLLNLFGMGIGLSAFAVNSATGAKTLAIGGFIAILIGTIVSTGTLGWVAGYFGGLRYPQKHVTGEFVNIGCVFGFTSWSLALILTILLSTQVGNFIAYTTAALANPSITIERVISDREATKTVATSVNKTVAVDQQEAAKSLATASFLSFVLFFIGALTATIAGHIAFARAFMKHNNVS